MTKKLIVIMLAAITGLTACSDKESSNPFFSQWDTPFGIPPFDEINDEHFMPAFEKGFEEHRKDIESITNNPEEPTFENTIKAFEYSGELLNKVSRTFYPINSANTNSTLEKVNSDVAEISSKHYDDIYLDSKLFQRVEAIHNKQNELNLSDEENRVLELMYKRFVRNGANLPETEKEKLRKINQELSQLTVRFGQNVLNDHNNFQLIIDDKEDLAGLPEGLINMAAGAASEAEKEGKWLFTLSAPSIWPFLQYSEKRDLREKIFKAYENRGNNGNEYDNNDIVARIVELRTEKANILGYTNHAEFVLEMNMARTPERVMDFLNQLWNAALPVAKAEARKQNELIRREGGDFTLEAWDWWYYTEKIKKEEFDLDDEITRPYFAVDNVRDGMFYVARRLYNLDFAQLHDVPVYHPDVQVFEATRNGEHIGVLFIDNFPRASKRGGAWCTAFRVQRMTPEYEMITPLVNIVGNYTPPSGDRPALMTADEANTFFHEFGHALHQLLSNVTYPSIAGTSVPRDFVELPSQIMEHWVLEPEVLKVYAKHYQTGEILPQEIIEKLEKAGKFNMGFTTIEYLAAALLDMEFYTLSVPVEINAREFEDAVMEKYGLINEIIPRYRSTYFNHIFSLGYDAGYYSYIWSERLDTDAFQAFRETGDIFNQEVAEAFEKEILSRGGSSDALNLYVNFRGREPGIEALLKHRGLDN
jgi:peptidyl-dipeptidase Dcp